MGLGGGRGLMLMAPYGMKIGLDGPSRGPSNPTIRMVISSLRCVRKMKFNMEKDICRYISMYYNTDILIIMDGYRYINRWEDAPIIVIS
jgi:hypothetical protein